MEKWRLLAIGLSGLVAVALVAGCGGGGARTTNIVSPYYGSIDGVDTEPADDETDIATDSWIRVFWPHAGFPPPREFTVRLEKEQTPGSWGVVHLIYRRDYSDPVGASWWFEPSNRFSTLTWYRIVVRDVGTGDTYRAYFLTTDLVTLRAVEAAPSGASSMKRHRPEGAENAPPSGQPGEVEHTIKTGK